MKFKVISLIGAALLLFSTVAAAQPRSFGVRFSTGLEMSYQHQFGTTSQGATFLEVDAGVVGASDFPGYRLSAFYDFTIWSLSAEAGVLEMFIGPGLGFGLYDKSDFLGAFHLQYGLSWRFSDIPLMVGVDISPCVALSSDYVGVPLREMIPMASIRWAF